ncbi:hypothetical protein [Dyadobacter psychrophilus]|uniref:Uncharacterized protein n=1 Tax=Dyadobacter psychrophilus TaxID=651661 RepID=A0A1T5BXQ3_9BACT|nr:hypothetical protein [Dyadobacter psychrophilus]SKB52142.1 hypothetical protein SAMN05660293_00713 [Dyadobacter psychrophilus]
MKTGIFIICFSFSIWMCSPRQLKSISETKNVTAQTKQRVCDETVSTSIVNALQNSSFVVDQYLPGDSILAYSKRSKGNLVDSGAAALIRKILSNKSLYKNPGPFTNLFRIYSESLVQTSRLVNQGIDTSDFIILSNHTRDVNARTFEIAGCYKKLILVNDIFAIFCHELPRNLYYLYDVKFFAKNKDDYDAFNSGRSKSLDLDVEFADSISLLSNAVDSKNKMRFASIVMNHLDASSWVEDDTLVDHQKAFMAIVTSSMEHFVIAHELAHIFRGHIGTNTPMQAISKYADTLINLNTKLFSWAEELEADYFGAMVFAEYLKGKPKSLTSNKLAKWSPSILMSNRQLYNKIQTIKVGGESWAPDEDISRFSANLKQLNENTATIDFHKLILSSIDISERYKTLKYPPEVYRNEVIKYALYKSSLLTKDEFESKNNLGSRWQEGLRIMYNSTKDDLKLAFDQFSKK